MNKCKYDAVVFDLLTGLIDSWSLWNEIAGSELMGRKWRAQYLEITYSTFNYKKYEDLVLLAAEDVGLNSKIVQNLIQKWSSLRPWLEVDEVLKVLSKNYLLGVATNCSIKEGNEAIKLIDITFDCSVTAEEIGFYKPHPKMYEGILKKLRVSPQKTLFVAGSPFDVEGAKAIGMDVYWHNRIGLKHKSKNRADYIEKSLNRLTDILK